MKRFWAVFSLALLLFAACVNGSANSGSLIDELSVREKGTFRGHLEALLAAELEARERNAVEHRLTDSRNVVYSVGDVLFYRVESLQTCAVGNYSISGWFEIEVLDEGKKNPFTGDSVLTLVETQAYAVMLIGPGAGVSHVSTIGGSVSRYFTQDPKTGTILYWGDSFPKPEGSGLSTVWFQAPYIPIDSPYRVGQEQQALYDRYSEVDGRLEYLDTLGSKVIVEGVETVVTDLGRFEAYKMAWYDAQGVLVRHQYLYPALGIVKFIFSPLPGCSGDMKMFISYTNIPNPT